MRQTTATLVLPEELEGRFFIRTTGQELVVELYKPRGRRVELAMEPGAYDVRVEREKASLTARTEVADGAHVTLDARQFGPAALEPTQRRGDVQPRLAVAGRNRVELRTGIWRVRDAGATTGTVISGDAVDAFGGIAFTKYVREDLAVTLTMDGVGIESHASVSAAGVSTGDVAALATFLGVRWNPIKGARERQALKPFVAVALGPVIGVSDGTFVGRGTVTAGSETRGTFGTRIGGGFDVHLARSFSVGLDVGYNWMADFTHPVGLHENFNGVQAAIGIGWLFGKGYTSTR